MKRSLDWRPSFDERSRLFGVQEVIEKENDNSGIAKIWEHGTILNQGQEGACVGFAWTGATIASPTPPNNQPTFEMGNSFAVALYKEAQKVDPWPGEDYSGTSVLAGAKTAKTKGIIDEYRWCFSVEDLKDAVLRLGPVVVGINWYHGMYHTGKNGLVRISGNKVGGHAIMITGFIPDFKINNVPTPVFEWVNSWGSGYGVNGKGYVKYEDMSRLIEERAEMCVPIKKNTPVLFGPNPEPDTEPVDPKIVEDVTKEINISPGQLQQLLVGIIKIITDIFKGKRK